MAARASSGAKSDSPITAKVAPTKEATPEMASASAARPCCAMGKPSSVVITAGSSPGMLSGIELIRPPYMQPK